MLLRAVVMLSALLAAFVPADSYLVLCGTAASATVGGRTFVGDATLPGSVLSAPQSAGANASAGAANASSGEAELYRSSPRRGGHRRAVRASERHGHGQGVLGERCRRHAGDRVDVFRPMGEVAFVNAIEVVSHPDDLFAGAAQTVNPLSQYAGLSTQAVENDQFTIQNT
ncbi:receptor-like protein kinase HERK 1 [Panicum miliaceum]|uniref:Receptor-like protein kinase HERK 1 n=1 Tax=Panicum miliaceum TaxID=4540 RepID=A0A3L6SJ67_PANMI|nr:receptor-like protein kinase HERK 1 [Panicum miliaceum]